MRNKEYSRVGALQTGHRGLTTTDCVMQLDKRRKVNNGIDQTIFRI
jgi:hypothetical protein